MNITVIGGGNIGTQFAVHSSDKGHSVKMFTSNPSRFSKHLFILYGELHNIYDSSWSGG